MSSLKLLKDHPKHGKKGTVATKVPFLEAKDLVAAGAAERWNGGRGEIAPESPTTVGMAVYEAALKKANDCEAKCKELSDEIAEWEKDAKKAAEEIAGLKAENKKLTEQLAVHQKAAGK